MAQGQRPARVGEEIRHELAQMLSRDVHDPGIGFVTLTRVTVSPDLQLARVYYTLMGDEKARKDTKRALERATPFLRRGIGSRLRLRRVPELMFHFDESIEKHDRIEKILIDLKEERAARESTDSGGLKPAPPDSPDSSDSSDSPGSSDSPDSSKGPKS
jgi:ribosome-binding factor A